MGILNHVTMYNGSWEVSNVSQFTAEEKALIAKAKVVDSQYGLSVCLFMKNGQKGFIPLSNTSNGNEGDVVDLETAKIIQLERVGDTPIYRVEL